MCLGKTNRRCTSNSSVSILLMTVLQLLAAVLLLRLQTADRRDVTGDEDDEDDDDGMTVSRVVDASDSELAYRFCSLIRLQQLRTADKPSFQSINQSIATTKKKNKIGKNKVGKAVGVDDVIIQSSFGFNILGVSDLQFRTLDMQSLQSINQLISK